jgi:hypothetical protein
VISQIGISVPDFWPAVVLIVEIGPAAAVGNES